MKIWKYPSSAALLINCCWSLLNHWLSLNNIAPSNDLNVVCFPSQGPLYCPRWSTCQGLLRSVDVILVKDFANSIDILLVWQSFCSGINSHTSKIMSIQNCLVTSCHFQASSHFCNQNTFNLQDWLTFIACWSLIKIFCQNKMLNICWFQNNQNKTCFVEG